MQTTMLKLSALLVFALPATIQSGENTETVNPTTVTDSATEITAISTVVLQRQQTPDFDSAEQATVAKEIPTVEAEADKSVLSENTDADATAVSDAIGDLVKPLIKKNINTDSQSDASTQITPCIGADCKADRKTQTEATDNSVCTATTPETIS